jgi:hypothetical protein
LQRIQTVCIERHNLSLRHENRRLTRKTIAFSKDALWLERQMHLSQAYYNCAPIEALSSYSGEMARIDGFAEHPRWLLAWPIICGASENLCALNGIIKNNRVTTSDVILCFNFIKLNEIITGTCGSHHVLFNR